MKPVLKIIQPGPHTSVQDEGRFGYQDNGIPVSGALDRESFNLANFLVGNPLGVAALEVRFEGPNLGDRHSLSPRGPHRNQGAP